MYSMSLDIRGGHRIELVVEVGLRAQTFSAPHAGLH
jgi:hypothetical protein